MNLLDTHFHLDLWSSPGQILGLIEKSKVYTIAVTNTPSVFNYTHSLTKNCKYTKPALGLHPELVFERHGELPLFHQLLSNTRYIGEIGLDYSGNDMSVQKLQRDVFESIIDGCAKSSDSKVLTVHSRRAEKDVIDIIGGSFPGKAILHWYSGSLRELRRAIEFGFYFSVNSAMVKSKSGRKLITNIPLERILTESDGPFILENNRMPASPLGVKNTVCNLAELMGKKVPEVREQIFINFRSILI